MLNWGRVRQGIRQGIGQRVRRFRAMRSRGSRTWERQSRGRSCSVDNLKDRCNKHNQGYSQGYSCSMVNLEIRCTVNPGNRCMVNRKDKFDKRSQG